MGFMLSRKGMDTWINTLDAYLGPGTREMIMPSLSLHSLVLWYLWFSPVHYDAHMLRG